MEDLTPSIMQSAWENVQLIFMSSKRNNRIRLCHDTLKSCV